LSKKYLSVEDANQIIPWIRALLDENDVQAEEVRQLREQLAEVTADAIKLYAERQAMDSELNKYHKLHDEGYNEMRLLIGQYEAQKDRITKMEQERDKLVKALEWYADANNYVQEYQPDGFMKFQSKMDEDLNGNLARTILKELKGESTE
jgi:DNA repair exonuclease SbcCD ATPase subunit